MRDIPYDERPYRPCVGIFLINDARQVFGGRRIDSRAEAWQMPQGGIDPGETVIDADPTDIFADGYAVSDVWGPDAGSLNRS